MRLYPNRKSLIEKITSEIQEDYDTTSFDSLKRASEDRGIIVIQTNKVVIPSAFYYPKAKSYFILLREPLFKDLDLCYLTHEMGHAFLSHYFLKLTETQLEDEAHYFQRLLGHEKIPQLHQDVSIINTLLTHPIATIRFSISPAYRPGYCERIVKELIE